MWGLEKPRRPRFARFKDLVHDSGKVGKLIIIEGGYSYGINVHYYLSSMLLACFS
jgi:hypothetical protein